MGSDKGSRARTLGVFSFRGLGCVWCFLQGTFIWRIMGLSK